MMTSKPSSLLLRAGVSELVPRCAQEQVSVLPLNNAHLFTYVCLQRRDAVFGRNEQQECGW